MVLGVTCLCFYFHQTSNKLQKTWVEVWEQSFPKLPRFRFHGHFPCMILCEFDCELWRRIIFGSYVSWQLFLFLWSIWGPAFWKNTKTWFQRLNGIPNQATNLIGFFLLTYRLAPLARWHYELWNRVYLVWLTLNKCDNSSIIIGLTFLHVYSTEGC